jgi:glucosamine 6-phosphate synthetase-like amidotransferase/phosphosugar isomerase protein
MIFNPPVTVIPLQLPAYHSAIVHGFDREKRLNPAMCVTAK